MGMSTFLANEILDHLLNADTYSTPSGTVHVALFTVAPTDAGGGTEVPFTNGYARVALDSTTVNQWSTAAARALDNLNDITFPTASGGNWGTIVAAGLYDASSGGNLLWWANLTTSRIVNDGDTFEFAVGDFDISIAAS